jgi:S-(hydroxymethyl)glutathione dehydrogenase/alcohol dehydrogenase
MRVRAVVLTEPNVLVVEELTVPALADDEVLVRVTASGLCHSDLHGYRQSSRFVGPTVLGHEVTGVVEEVGATVQRLKPGDRVVGSWVPACGECAWCLDGETHLCRELGPSHSGPRLARSDGTLIRRATGLGGFAEAMLCGSRSLVKVETELPDEQLALLGCGVATGVGAVFNTARVRPGSSVAVFGCGGVGQSVIAGARIAGADRIIAVDPVPDKLTAAVHSGATHTIEPNADGVAEAVFDATGGRGADFVFEVSGRADSLANAWAATRRGGTLVPVGAQEANALYPFTAYEQLFNEKKLLGCLYGSTEMRRDFPMLVRLAESGKLDLAAMVSRKIRLEDVQDGLHAIEAGQVIRQVMVP